MGSIFSGKTVLITGGTGSFGRAFAKKLLLEDFCSKVVIFSRDEWKQWEMKQADPLFNHPKIRYFLGDIRDEKRLARAFNEVHIVVHAAALKQVPAAEYNPSEFVKTNVIGAMQIIDAAIDCRVERVIALSTDKACNPVNLYGATKLCSDKLFVSGNAYVGSRGYPRFSVVRYGNVLGSRGSILPFWQKMIEEGATSLPITDARMTRFWITLKEAVDFVAEALSKMLGGEIFIPKIPSMKIVDLASALAPLLPKHFVGIREGEKLHEMMISQEDAHRTLERESHYVILPEIEHRDPLSLKRFLNVEVSSPVKENFCYTSDGNTKWISKETLQKLLKSTP